MSRGAYRYAFGMAAEDHLPTDLWDKYEIHEWRHACAVLKGEFPAEWNDVCDVLRGFRLKKSEVIAPGGRKSLVADRLDGEFFQRGWVEKSFGTSIRVDDDEFETPTHAVDCFKNSIALEIEWSNKDPFYDRDLNNFRLLFELRAVSVGIILTKSDELKDVFKGIRVKESKTLYRKFGASTTWMSKLVPRIDGGGGGGCPILVFGIKANTFDADCEDPYTE